MGTQQACMQRLGWARLSRVCSGWRQSCARSGCPRRSAEPPAPAGQREVVRGEGTPKFFHPLPNTIPIIHPTHPPPGTPPAWKPPAPTCPRAAEGRRQAPGTRATAAAAAAPGCRHHRLLPHPPPAMHFPQLRRPAGGGAAAEAAAVAAVVAAPPLRPPAPAALRQRWAEAERRRACRDRCASSLQGGHMNSRAQAVSRLAGDHSAVSVPVPSTC